MIVDERTYTLHIGKIPEYLKLYRAEGLKIQKKTLGNLIGYCYDSMEDRARRRAELAANPAWQAYLAKMQPLVTAMENRVLTPTALSPLK